MTDADRWADLRVRVVSATVLVVLGAIAVIAGGPVFAAMILAAVGAMIWELAGMTAPDNTVRVAIALITPFCLGLPLMVPMPIGFVLMLLPSLGLFFTPRRDRLLIAVYALAVMLAGAGFLALRTGGAEAFLWLVMVVVASDTMGYFAGRMIGGPKFWPHISPKKTWSGTVAGWIGAAIVGAAFALFSDLSMGLGDPVAAGRLCRADGRHRRKLDQTQGRGQGRL